MLFQSKTKVGEYTEFIDKNKYQNSIGIYKIVNQKNDCVYIGQTGESFQRRFWLHRWQLRHGVHDNVNLQHDWDMFGESSFSFEVIEECINEWLDNRESYWIAFYTDQQKCYNIQPGGRVVLVQYVSPEGHKRAGEKNRERMLGTTLGEETRSKMSRSRKGKRVYRNNDRLTDQQAVLAKTMFVEGKTSRQIMDALNIPYKPINAILSNNAYSTIYVDGWDAFLDKHRREVKERKALVARIKPLWLDGYDIASIAQILDLPTYIVKYHVKKI